LPPIGREGQFSHFPSNTGFAEFRLPAQLVDALLYLKKKSDAHATALIPLLNEQEAKYSQIWKYCTTQFAHGDDGQKQDVERSCDDVIAEPLGLATQGNLGLVLFCYKYKQS
jgi:hypothetical protein